MQKTILITGKNGQLGNEIQVLAKNYPDIQFIYTDVEELDITNEESVSMFFDEYKPMACINAAAYTAVDKSETDRDLCMKINATAVGYLAANCQKIGSTFIHVSTDYVFDGNADSPYQENYPVNPVNYYGQTKLRGEQEAMEKNPSSIIIRTSWVYSFFGNNFVKTMLRLMKERESISVVGDQYGSPTYAADLAEVILQIATKPNKSPGIYHYSNEGNISWFDFAVAIRDNAGLSCQVQNIDTASYPTPAKRPHYSVMSKEKIVSTFGFSLKPWRDSLQKCMDLLEGK